MAMANSSFPKTTLCGFQVLLVETDKRTLQHHAYMLFQNSYRVTSTLKISEALSMIVNKRTFDCVLVDAENRDMDLVDFLHTIWTYQPKLRIVVMTSNDFHMQLAKENIANDVIWFLRKPIAISSICDTLQHVCISGLTFEEGEGVSTGKSPEENHNNSNNKIVQNVSTARSPTIYNITMINNNNNNTSPSNGTHQGLNIINHKYGSLSKPAAYVDISSDDDNTDEATRNKNILFGTAGNKDKGKQPMELKRKNELPAEDDINRQKRKEINSRISWTPPVRGAYPKGAVLNHMKVPDRTRAKYPSPLKKIQERANLSMKPPRLVLGPMTKNIDWQLESNISKRSGLSLPFYNNASMKNSSIIIPQAFDHNSYGVSFVNFDNVLARGGPLPLPQQITTNINYSVGDQIQPPIGQPQTSINRDFVLINENSRSGGTAVNEVLAPLVDRFGIPVETSITVGGGGHGEASGGTNLVPLVDRFGIPVETSVTVGGGGRGEASGGTSLVPLVDRFGIPVETSLTFGGRVEASSNVIGLDDFIFPEFSSQDLRDIVCPPQEFQGNGEALCDVANADAVNVENVSTSFPPSISGVGNTFEAHVQPSGNSIVPLQGSEGRVIDDDWYVNLIHGFNLDSFTMASLI